MVQTVFPNCPVCKRHARKEALIPLSAIWGEYQKTFAHWVCPKCGFYIGTDRHGYNVPKDIKIGIIPEIPTFIDDKEKSSPP